MTAPQLCALFLSGLLGGALNAVAGGGILFTLPTLILCGAGPISANATSTVALWPGTAASAGAYREELAVQPRLLMALLCGSSLVGGGCGAFLLLHTSAVAFSRLIPFLLLVVTLLFGFGTPLAAKLETRRGNTTQKRWRTLSSSVLVQFGIAIYGGYFGGGSILMLASLMLMGMEDIHRMNALRALLATCITGAAVIGLALAGVVLWPQTIIMIAGAIAGGYGGARYARRLDPLLVRRFIVLVGFCITIFFFMRSYA